MIGGNGKYHYSDARMDQNHLIGNPVKVPVDLHLNLSRDTQLEMRLFTMKPTK